MIVHIKLLSLVKGKEKKRPKEMTGKLAFLGVTSERGNNLKPQACLH